MSVNKNFYVGIMAGGVGTRFWPSSTTERPKQFLDILGVGKSLLQMTYERFVKIIPKENILIVTNKTYASLVKEQLPDVLTKNILCEPSRNNTGPCVAYTALRLYRENPEAVFVIAPSDHVILKEETFLGHILTALSQASKNHRIYTLGISPTRPDTGYGYINVAKTIVLGEEQKVEAFKEKPDLSTALNYLGSGQYLWNGGIFIWKASNLLEDFRRYAPNIISILEQDITKYNTPDEQAYIDEVYPDTENISIDYAILERAPHVYTIPVDIGWSDLGTWTSLHDYLHKDENNSVTIGENTFLIDTENSIIRSDSKKIVVIKGLKDYIVVDEQDALLIYPKDKEQEIKKVVESLVKTGN
jgi:mannose-1-phosphate guanylyltransferase